LSRATTTSQGLADRTLRGVPPSPREAHRSILGMKSPLAWPR
jgi:hypothetical protein